MQRISLLERQLWVIRGGESGVGEHEEEFLKDGVVTVGFGCDRPVTSFGTRNELQRYLEDQRRHEGMQSSRQLWDFAHKVQMGDEVVLTRTMRGHERELALGRVTGGYQFREGHGHQHLRTVEWRRTGASKSGLDGVALRRINQRTTLTLISDEDVAKRIRSHCLTR